MYGDPLWSVPHVRHARHVLALDPYRGPRLAGKPFYCFGTVQRCGRQELERDALAELEVSGGNHDAHASLPKHPLDSVLAR